MSQNELVTTMPEVSPEASGARWLWQTIRANPSAFVGFVLFSLIVVAAVFGPLLPSRPLLHAGSARLRNRLVDFYPVIQASNA